MADGRPSEVAARVDGVYDIAVVGAGLVGAAAALGAAQLGLRVLLIDRAEPVWRPGHLGMDIRNVAVSPASQALLHDLGVWAEQQAVAYSHMRVWEERGTRVIEFDAADVQRGELGWILENGPLVAALWSRLRAHDGVTLQASDLLVGLELGDAAVELRMAPARIEEDGQPKAGSWTTRARLVVAADGARSVVRTLLDVALETFETGHHALATVVRTSSPHQGTAFQRFLLDGPLALLPGKHPQHCSVVWSQSPAAAERRAALSAQAFCSEITVATEKCLGEVEAVDERLVFPLQQQLVSSFHPVQRVLLIGDAARVLHPLAGLGANLGFEDVRDLLDQLEVLRPGIDPGARGLWHAFARRRRARGRLMLELMAGLRRIYGSSDPLLLWLRNIGVSWIDAAAPVKRQIIREALGLGPIARVSGQ